MIKTKIKQTNKKRIKITTRKKNKQKINILCFDSRRWKALNAADLYKSNLIKNDDLINQKLHVFLLVDYYARFISWVWTSNVELGMLTFKICVVDEMLFDLCARSNDTYSIFIPYARH